MACIHNFANDVQVGVDYRLGPSWRRLVIGYDEQAISAPAFDRPLLPVTQVTCLELSEACKWC